MHNGKDPNQRNALPRSEMDTRESSSSERQRFSSNIILPEEFREHPISVIGPLDAESLVRKENPQPFVHIAHQKKSSERTPVATRIGVFRKEGISTGLEEHSWIRYAYHEVIRHAYTSSAEIGRYDQLEMAPTNVPLWRSYFAFDGKIVAYLKEHKRVLKNYPEKVGINEIIIDLDTKDGILFDDVFKEARNLVQYLTGFHEIPLDYLRVFFSGSKGFHLHMPDLFGFAPSIDLPERLHATLEHEFSFCKSMDLSMIRTNGLIRVPYSRHQITGLYKQPLPWELFFSGKAEDVLSYSVEPIFLKWYLPDEIETSLSKLKMAPVITARVNSISHIEVTDRVTCMQKLYNRGAINGRGHDDSLRLASWLRRSGLPQDAALAVLKDWYNNVETEDQKKIVQSVYTKKYSYSCQDRVMKEFCDSKCMFYKKEWADERISDMAKNSTALLGGLKEYVKRLGTSNWIDLKTIWSSMPDPYCIYPGEVVMITGDTGMGKSALVQNIILVAKMKTLWLNLEMGEDLTTRRFLQAAHSMTKKEVIRSVTTMPDEELIAPIKHIEMISIAPKHKEVIEEVAKRRPEILVIDTSDGIEVESAGNNEMHQLKVVVEMMRRLAQQYQIIVIAIHHINKDASKKGLIDLNSLVGNRSAVTKVDHVLAFTGIRNNPERKFRSLKSRDEKPFVITLKFDGSRMKVTDADAGAPLFDPEDE